MTNDNASFPPLAVYIHWPFCKAKCPYCDFNSHVREQIEVDAWQKALLSELRYMASHTQGHEVQSIFFGGGTPSLMPPAIAEALIAETCRLWPVSDHIEITLEANPTSVETGTFADFKAAGINRVSIGVQSFDQAELSFLGREHSAREAQKAIESAARIFDRYSFDLIYALPDQTPDAWRAALTKALTYADKHLSLYQLTIEPNTAFATAYKKQQFALPEEGAAEAMYRATEEVMSAHGLPAYEVSNYASPGEESRHNCAYWRGHAYVGVGPGAHGRINGDNHQRIATQTLKSPERWLEGATKNGSAIEAWEVLDTEAHCEERVLMGLRMREGINAGMFKQQTGVALAGAINAQKRGLCEQEGLLVPGENLQATLKGLLLLTSLTQALLT